MELPRAFVEQMKNQLGAEADAFFASYDAPSLAGLRVNARRNWQPGDGFERVPWCPTGYVVPEGLRMGKNPLHAAGAYYLQEPSAMAPVEALAVRPGLRVLDLCASPGGKSTQIADKLRGQGLLVANEIHPQRARILLENIERMGVGNAVVLNETPARIAAHFGAWFDAVLVDAPCSGEGMFRKDPDAVSQWTEDSPRLCHERQLDILRSAAQCLCGGGTMVYSTCTYNEMENEQTMQAFLQEHPEFSLDAPLSLPGIDCQGGMAHLYPHRLRGEGHFLARLHKAGDEAHELPLLAPDRPDDRWTAFASAFLKNLSDLPTYAQGEWLYSLPSGTPQLKGLHVLRAGVQLGKLARGRLEPAHALALALPDGCAGRQEVSDEDALRFLRGETLTGTLSGWGLVCCQGQPLGWGKGSGGQIKNHIPKGLRWN